MLMIVDQAHGAHLRFFDYLAQQNRDSGTFVIKTRSAAESLGADIVINSTHKTLFSFTGSGILNVCSDKVDIRRLSDTLRMLQTTSPSYILMASLDVNEKMMREYGASVINHWKQDLTDFYKAAARIEGLTTVTGAGMDLTKINISMVKLGLTGEQLDRELRHRNIISEMVHGQFVMLMTGAGSRTGDYATLLTALKEISGEYSIGAHGSSGTGRMAVLQSIPDYLLEVADVPVESELTPLYGSEGCIMYDPIIVYPPGTPVICPGEIMTMEVINYISGAIARDEKVTGVDDEGMIRTGTFI
jgi:lysine decarboxylase